MRQWLEASACGRRRLVTAGKADTMIAVFVIVALILVAVIGGAMSVRILKQYERGVQFRLGRVKAAPAGRA